ncbi:phage major capsid protein [Mesorhizobium huakuii]|uniref:Phage major capsid protein n=1 Tax=Mesorhizobium huakuii TaxID=28104 RepID=A0A7G6SZB7_9HYPH|nr:phage major capsid protein [Mesorhizobium huakuii]QND59849.1 phage major capsid protein [Mesorhizobium huakuii]
MLASGLRRRCFSKKKAAAWCGDRGIAIEKAAQGELVGGSGGFTVPEEIESEIIEYRNSLAVFRQEARIRQMGSSSLSVPKRTGALAGYYIGENVPLTESDNAWGNIEHVAKKACGADPSLKRNVGGFRRGSRRVLRGGTQRLLR